MTCDLAIFSIWQRCGSTLLQRMAARRPDTLIWGECGRWLNHLAHLMDGALDFSRASDGVRELVLSGRRPTEASDIEALANLAPDPDRCEVGAVEATRGFFAAAFRHPGFAHVGFKEVCIGEGGIRLFLSAFPDSDVVLLVRDPAAIWRSIPADWLSYSRDYFLREWNRSYALYEELAASDRRVRLVYFEDVVTQDPRTLETLADAFHVDRADLCSELNVKGNSTASSQQLADEERFTFGILCPRYRRD